MKSKIFNIRLQKEFFSIDEEKLNNFLKNTKINHINSTLVQTNKLFWSILIFYDDKKIEEKGDKNYLDIPDRKLSEDEEIILLNLKRWRIFQSSQDGLPLYAIAHNKMLIQMILLPVKNMDDFRHIKGFGEKRAQKYGEEILDIIQKGFNSLNPIDNI